MGAGPPLPVTSGADAPAPGAVPAIRTPRRGGHDLGITPVPAKIPLMGCLFSPLKVMSRTTEGSHETSDGRTLTQFEVDWGVDGVKRGLQRGDLQLGSDGLYYTRSSKYFKSREAVDETEASSRSDADPSHVLSLQDHQGIQTLQHQQPQLANTAAIPGPRVWTADSPNRAVSVSTKGKTADAKALRVLETARKKCEAAVVTAKGVARSLREA